MIRTRTVGVAAVAVALAVAVVGCGISEPPAAKETAASQNWTPEQQLLEDKQYNAEMLGLDDPPEVEVIRFIMPNESAVWVDCLNQAGYDFKVTEDGAGVYYPKDQRPEIMDAMNLAIYTCTESYPMDPKYSAPPTEERLRWLYVYRSTTMLECFADQGYPFEGKVPSEQAYIDANGNWSPFGSKPPSESAYKQLQKNCPDSPPEYYAQPFW